MLRYPLPKKGHVTLHSDFKWKYKTQSIENEIQNIENNFNLSWHHLDVYISWEPLPEFANVWAIVCLWLIF